LEHCVFCKIVRGELPSRKVWETENLLAFEDIRPQAPVHVLLIPKKHIVSTQDVGEEDRALMGELHVTIAQVATKLNIAETGYRVVANTGFHGQQTVGHLHYHILGGRQMGWPPG